MNHARSLVALALLAIGCGNTTNSTEPGATMSVPTCDGECVHAIELAKEAMTERGEDPKRYKLVGAANVLAEGPQVWDLTFKLARLIPDSPDELVGKGGEVYIRVDVSTGRLEVRGH